MSSAAENSLHTGVFWTPPPKWITPRGYVPAMPRSENNARRSIYHIHHKVPPVDSPYGFAKKVQLVDKDPSKAVSLFWAAINSGDRVDSALKDMAVVMKQLNRSDEAIEAIKSFRYLCPPDSQEALDNILLVLYKSSGKLQEEIQMLQDKLKHIEEGIIVRGKRTKVGRSQGRKVHITVETEYSRLLGNLAWAYLQQKNYRSAEELYRKALLLEPDKNKQCNLAICLMHLNKITEAKFLLQSVRTSCENGQINESFSRSFDRAIQILRNFESNNSLKSINQKEGMFGEIQKSFSSYARINFRGPSQSANANNHPGSEILKRSAEIHQDEMLQLVELNGASSNFHDSCISVSGSKRRNIKGTWCGGRRLSNGPNEEDYVCVKEYDASFSLAKNAKVLFTQPQRCSRLGNKGNHGRAWYAEESNGGCSRKLLFQQEKSSENVQFLPYHNFDQYKEPESERGSTNEDSKENILGDPAEINGESSIISISLEVQERELFEVGEQRKDTKDEFNLGSEISVGGYSTIMKEFSDFDEDSGQNLTSPAVHSTGLTEAAENGNEIQKSSQQLKTNVEYLQDISAIQNKKSWADMVEEDDQELLNERKDTLAYEQGFPSQASILPRKNTPNKYPHDSEAREQFADENRNSNTILETPCSLDKCESLKQKIESLILINSCYYTQPLHAGSPMNQTARQVFCYDHYGNLDKVRNSLVSPLQKRSLNFERDNSAPLEEDHTPLEASELIQGKG